MGDGRDVHQHSEAGLRHLAGDLADTLAAMTRLLHAAGLSDLPTSPLTHSLSTTVQHLSSGAALARQVSCGAACSAAAPPRGASTQAPDD